MAVRLIFFKEEDGSIPLLEWLDRVPEKALVKCLHRMDRLREVGHLLRRPEADYLRDGIYELRVRHMRLNYRMLYFFHGNSVVVVSHGLVKEARVPIREIETAVERMGRFRNDPTRYSAGSTEDEGK